MNVSSECEAVFALPVVAQFHRYVQSLMQPSVGFQGSWLVVAFQSGSDPDSESGRCPSINCIAQMELRKSSNCWRCVGLRRIKRSRGAVASPSLARIASFTVAARPAWRDGALARRPHSGAGLISHGAAVPLAMPAPCEPQ